HQNAAGLAVRLLLQDGNGQSGAVGAALPTPIAIKVLDANGLGVPGATVTFSVRKGNGTLGSPTAVSDTAGVARTTWKMGNTPGAGSVTAILSTALVLDSVVVTATAITGPAAIVNVTAGDSQNAGTGSLLPTAIAVQVTDILGNPVAGVTVNWSLAAANLGGTVSPASSTSDANGNATTQWTLGAFSGVQVLNVLVAGAPTLAVHANAASPNANATFKIVSGNGQVGQSAGQLQQPLVVSVADAKGVPISGVQVNWAQGSGNLDGHIAPNPAVTDANGQASVLWTLGANNRDSVAVDSVTATLSGNLPGTGTLVFTASARPAPRVRFIRGTTAGQPAGSQVDTTGATLGDTLIMQVYDPATGNGVAGISVTWTPQAGDAVDGTSVNSVVTTDNFGYAKNIWVLRSNAGVPIPPNTVAKRMIASAANIGQVEYRARVYPGRWSNVSVVTAPVNLHADSSNTVVFKVTDSNGYAISGATIGVAVTAGTASGGGFTAADGTFSVAWKFGAAAGPQSISITVTTFATGPYTETRGPSTYTAAYGVNP
ncbi:MAG: Ig-like domain-containing protein, partial [Gemmatimonadetes bacterium]|nr:Ig-like domain-containing protein [Gemmatimonadota bacterium]